MKVVHWTLSNQSGLNRMATMISGAETSIGLDSYVSYTDGGEGLSLSPAVYKVLPKEEAFDADVHVMHSFVPPEAKGKKVFIAHGTPEHCFQIAVEQCKSNYAGGDPLMLTYYCIDNMDVTVTFWPRHHQILQSFNPKALIETVPMGVDKTAWFKVENVGKSIGTPSVFTAENCHYIKWPLDIILAWPFVVKNHKGATLHLHYLPQDMHRFFYPLICKTGVSYKSFSSSNYFTPVGLRTSFSTIDYYLSLVRYGDFNTICLEAKASGCKVISYRGNPYTDYWLTEGDQRTMAEELLAIFRGDTKPRETTTVPDIKETAEAMLKIYERVLHKNYVNIPFQSIVQPDNGDEAVTTTSANVEDLNKKQKSQEYDFTRYQK
jgi:hypothetical protein